MKSFFAADQSVEMPIDIYAHAAVHDADAPQAVSPDRSVRASADSLVHFAARVAVYDALSAAPRVEDVQEGSPRALIDTLSELVYELAHKAGGAAPYTVIREVVENLIHADFREIVVSILDGGNTLRFADQGPGIPDKDRALRPGFSTATVVMKDFIRGVGSGLPIVSEFLNHNGGRLEIEDNLGRGTVVTLVLRPEQQTDVTPSAVELPAPGSDLDDSMPTLSLRQKKVLSLVLELGEVGPTLVSKELAVGLSTAYRDLASLEEYGLIDGDETGKRVLTAKGSAYLGRLFD